MTKFEKARMLIEKHGFSRNGYRAVEQYEKTYSSKETYRGKETCYSRWVNKVTVTIELYTDDCEDLTNLKAVQDSIEQAVDDVEELQDEIDDLEGDKEELEQNDTKL